MLSRKKTDNEKNSLDLSHKINDNEEKIKSMKNSNDLRLMKENQPIKMKSQDLKTDDRLVGKKRKDLYDNQYINTQEHFINDSYPNKNNFEFFKRNKNKIIFLIFCFILVILFIYSLIKFSSITKIIKNNEISINEKLDYIKIKFTK